MVLFKNGGMSVIWKTRGESVDKERAEVLLRRLPKTHKSYPLAKSDLWNAESGISGERRFDDYFSASKLNFSHIILHDISLKSVLPFQLDSLLITPWCLYVFEVKNMSGRLHFKQSPPQLIQIKDDGSVTGRKSPIEQIETNEWLLEEWLSSREYFLPISSVLVFSYPKQMPENLPKEQISIFSSQLPLFLHKLEPAKEILSLSGMQKLAAELRAAHSPYAHDPLCANSAFPIDVMHRGVWCENCDSLGMKRQYGTWFCPSCGISSKDAHIRALKDWKILTGHPLTNKLCREILQIEDRHVVKRLMAGMKIEKRGAFKGTNYVLEARRSYRV